MINSLFSFSLFYSILFSLSMPCVNMVEREKRGGGEVVGKYSILLLREE